MIIVGVEDASIYISFFMKYLFTYFTHKRKFFSLLLEKKCSCVMAGFLYQCTNKQCKQSQVVDLLKEKKLYSTLSRWPENGQAQKKSNCPKEQRNLGFYSNEGIKYLGVSSQVFPGWVLADHSFPSGGRIFVLTSPFSELSWRHRGCSFCLAAMLMIL